MHSSRKGFTLIELLIVIAIIGLLSTIAVVALNNARGKTRDAKRVADVKQIQTALELYFADNRVYPLMASATEIGTATRRTLCGSGTFSATCTGKVYMAKVPQYPQQLDGACTTVNNRYTYTSAAPQNNYTIVFCLGGQTASLTSGLHTADPAGIR